MFEIGQHVICVDASYQQPEWQKLTKGKVYTIRGLPTLGDEFGLWLEEIINTKHMPSGLERAYKPCRFRPLRRLTIDEFTQSASFDEIGATAVCVKVPNQS